jgi:ABC-2 type transport system ATP-binding protein
VIHGRVLCPADRLRASRVAIRPHAGAVTAHGESDPTRESVRRRIGTAPQSIVLCDDLTGEGNLRFFGTLCGRAGTRLRERVGWGLGFAGLEARGRGRGRVAGCSGGMKRRLNLVAGLLHDPPVVRLDEPTAGVDPQSRNHLFRTIGALTREGRTEVHTTRCMEEAQRLCDRVAILDGGRVMALHTVDGRIARHGGEPVTRVERGNLGTVLLGLTGRTRRDV